MTKIEQAGRMPAGTAAKMAPGGETQTVIDQFAVAVSPESWLYDAVT